MYFFLPPPAEIRREIAQCCSPALVGTPVREDRLHVTIGTAGGYDETPRGVIALIVEALADLVQVPLRHAVEDEKGNGGGRGHGVRRSKWRR